MPTSTDDSTPRSEDDPEFDEMVAEVSDRLRAGEAIDFEAIAGGDPDRADRLRKLVPMMALMADLGRSADAGTTDDDTPDLGVLGDYRLIRQVGRGGMGVVYEARKLSIDRRVALKVLPTASAIDPKRVARFQLEAQAAAYLSHRNIVPVYEVGREGRLNYYVMQFIDGPSLAEVVAVLRFRSRPTVEPRPEPPAPDSANRTADRLTAPDHPAGGPDDRAVKADRPAVDIAPEGDDRTPLGRSYVRAIARLGVQAAEALEHAHRLGIVHRDIKPANLLIDADANLWITDFGLARVRDFGDLALTPDGDQLGTLRYMSPEQAISRGPLIDHRTDIYSLGATLYELLTIEPAFDGKDREAILRRIAENAPTLPRRINPAIPRDLETIVLKAMAGEPKARYASAAEMALDLRNLLDHRSILARRPSLLDRFGKWSRRHRVPIAAASATAAVALVVGLAVVASAFEAERAQRERAESNARLALWTLGEVADRIAGDERLTLRGMGGLQIELLEVALPRLEAFLTLEGGVEADLIRGRALNTLSQLYAILGRFDEAAEAADRAEAAFAALERAGRPDPAPEVRYGLAVSGAAKGAVIGRSRDRVDEALALIDRSIALLEGLRDEGWDEESDLGLRIAECWNNRGNCLRMLDAERAVADYERALDHFAALDRSGGDAPARLWLVKGRSNLALVLAHLGRVPDATRNHAEAVAIGRGFVADLADARDRPGADDREALLSYDLDFRYALAVALTNQGEHLASLGRLGEAEPILRETLALYDGLADAVPHYLEYPWSVAMARTNLAWAIGDDPSRVDEAATLLRAAGDWYESALSGDPENAELAVYSGVNRLRLAEAEAARSGAEGGAAGPAAIEAFEEAIDAFRRAGDGPEPLLLRGEALVGLGDAHESAGAFDLAADAWDRARAALGPLEGRIGPTPTLAALLSRVEARLASAAARRGAATEAADLLDQARDRLAAAREAGLGGPALDEAERDIDRRSAADPLP